MLQITIDSVDLYDESKKKFITSKSQILQLEHSLVSLSKWESRWEKPFLVKTDKTQEETIDYIRCMTLTQNVELGIYEFIDQKNLNIIGQYINAPMTATTFPKDDKNVLNRDIITSEIIYSWMVTLTIPFECQKWHLNRLLTLINVCNIKNQPAKKMKPKDILARNRALNEARLNELKTTG